MVPAKRKRRVPLWRRIIFRTLQVLGILFLLGVISGATALAVVYNRTSLPAVDANVVAQTSTAYYADGTFLADWKAKDRTIVTTDRIPQHVKNAFVAAEDRTFYDNRGVSFTGIARAVWGQLRGNQAAGGGSTITQQYVRNTYVGLDDRSWKRKGKELILAVKIDREKEKDEILTDYLNTIYFGRLSYGIQAASESYFGVPADQLTPAQAALLAGILPAPVKYDPAVDPTAAKARFDYVVQGLVATKAITETEAQTMVFPETLPPSDDGGQLAGPNGYLKEMVMAELQTKLGYTEKDVQTSGLSITTTFLPAEQQKAYDAVHSGLEEALAPTGGVFPTGLRAGLAAIDPTTGEVRAIYAGEDPASIPNTVTFDTYQPGSTMKPFALIAGLQSGKKLTDTYSGKSPVVIEGAPKPFENFGGTQFGKINLVTATANSVNTVYAQLNSEIGASTSYKAMVDAGLPPGCAEAGSTPDHCTTDLAQFEVGNILGSASPHVMDMAQAYATIAGGGVRHDWHIIREVKGPDGAVQRTADTTAHPALDPGAVADATYAMTQVIQKGSGNKELGDIERPLAGKTGTASDNKAASFAGFTPQLTTVVALWQKGPDGKSVDQLVLPGVNQVTGGSYPARIFNRYITAALDGAPVLDFPEPTVTPPPQRTAAPATTREPDPTTASEAPPETTFAPTIEPSFTNAPTTAPQTTAPTATSPPPTTQPPTTVPPTTDPPVTATTAPPAQ